MKYVILALSIFCITTMAHAEWNGEVLDPTPYLNGPPGQDDTVELELTVVPIYKNVTKCYTKLIPAKRNLFEEIFHIKKAPIKKKICYTEKVLDDVVLK